MSDDRLASESERWDKLKSWSKVKEQIDSRLKNTEKYDDSMTLSYGPQLFHTFRNPASIKCMTHFTSNVGEVFVSHYRLGTQDQLSVWTLNSMERSAKCEYQRFDINGEVKAFLFIPKHRVYMCFCSDLVMRIYTEAHSKCTETSSLQCMTTVRCMAYNRDTDDVYIGGIGVLQKWRITGSEHSAAAEPGPVFNTELREDEWVIDIKVDIRNKQLMAVTYEGIFVVNYETMKQTHHLQNRHDNSLRCCCFYKDREYFITGGGDGEVKVWNAVVFTQVHVFYGHHDVITGLQTHKTEPLLFSSSLDGSVQIWRMDNFSKFMRLDLAEKVYSMKLVVDEEFYCQTEKEIRIYSLNQFYNLFAPVESSVYKLELCPAVKGHPSRIIASTEDGSVRLFSPVTGLTLTIIYPMPTFQVLSSFAYSREKNRLHCVLQTGQVLTFNCDTNPCRAVEVWTADTVDEEVLQIVQLTLGYEKNGSRVTDTVILGGLRNGQISLLDASECVLIKNLQAHEGNITCMEKATDIGETGFKLLETSQKMATGGADRFIKIWALSVNCGKLYHNIVIELLLKIPCSFTPEYISMYENTISVSSSDRSDKGKLHMFRMDCQESKEYQYSTLQHPQDEDHAEHITALDKCPLLGLFATASEDGFIKIWNRHNQLIREMGFGEPMHGLCFANIRGDILFGFQNHICTIPLTSYFPRNYLERITRQEFKDEYRETPIAYNHRIRPWFDLKALPQYSISVAKRIVEKKPVEEEDILEDLEATPRSPALEPEDRPDQEDSDDDYTELPAVTIESPSTEGITDKTVKAVKSRIRKQHQGEDTDNKQGEFVERVLSAPSSDHRRRLKLERMKEERRKSDAQYLEKLSPWERDLFKKHPIIAPDGYIPNSVARKRLGFRPPPTPPKKTKDTWTIESIRLPVTPKPVYKKPTEEEDERWEEEFRSFNWGDFDKAEEGRQSTSSYSPWKRVQTMVRATSTLSNQSTTSSKRGLTRSRRSTPTTPIYELKSKKFEFHRVDLDLGTPERMKRSVGTMSREKSKSFRLTNMVVDEQSTNVTFKEGSKSGHRKGILPAVDMDIIRRLLAEDFCLDLQGTASFDSIMQHLIKLLDTANQALHAKICDYIIAIHREIGIQDHYLERIISKLSTQIGGDNSALKLTGIRTLKEIGINRQDVLASILPRLLDTMEEALKALAMRLDVPFRSDSFADWINNWVDDSSSIYDSEPEVKLDDIEKAWDGRQHKWKQESLCMTEAASRASTRLKELSFQSKGSRSPIQETEEYVPDKLKIEDLDRVKTEGQLSDRSSRSGRRSVKFDPRDPSLYRYYKDRYNKEKETDGKFNYRNMSKQFSKSHIGGGEDVDSQIGSLDSQMGDALSTNDSGIMSMQDSGIGCEISDTYSRKSSKASGMLSKEKIYSKAGSYTSRIDSHRKHNLSPVKSSSTLGGMSAKSSPRAKDPDWMKFFQTPTALERKRMVMVKKEFSEGKVKPGNAAVINYISDGLPMLPGEAGLRLLKSVRVASNKSLPPCTEKYHRIESIPGKLGVHTKHEDKGQSKYGILQMQWTTTVPAPISHDTYNGRYSAMSDATSTLGGSSVNTFSSKRVLPAIVEKYGNSDRNETSAFEEDEPDYHHLSGGYTPDYEWDYPIPPPPAKESRISVPYIKKEHENYCKYYNMLKKKGGILKKSQSKLLLPTVEIKKVLPERLKLPKDVTKLSRLSSILFPSLTLNQLLSARS